MLKNWRLNRICRLLVILFFVSGICLVLGRYTEIHAAKVNISNEDLGGFYAKPDVYKPLVNRIGGMKISSNSDYQTFYASGNHMTIGVNRNARYPRHYYIISNTGNKNVSFLGMTIGMKYSKAVKNLQANSHLSKYKKTIFYGGDAATLYLSLKNGKISGWKFICAPTS